MGNRDVPDWLLAEVATLSRIASAVHQVEMHPFAPPPRDALTTAHCRRVCG